MVAEKTSSQGLRDMMDNREKMLGSSIAIDEPPVKYARGQDLRQNVQRPQFDQQQADQDNDINQQQYVNQM